MSFVEQSVIIKKISLQRLIKRNLVLQVVYVLLLIFLTWKIERSLSPPDVFIYLIYFWGSLFSILYIIGNSFRPMHLKNIGPRLRKNYYISFASFLFLPFIYYYSYQIFEFKRWIPAVNIYEVDGSQKRFLMSNSEVFGDDLFITIHLRYTKVGNDYKCFKQSVSIPLLDLKEYSEKKNLNLTKIKKHPNKLLFKGEVYYLNNEESSCSNFKNFIPFKSKVFTLK